MRKILTLTFLSIMLSVASYALTPITGPHSMCVGGTVYLDDSLSPGGTWSSSDITIATVGSSSGIVSGVSAGVCDITYTLGSAYVTISMTVSPAPASITGSGSVCVSSSITLADATPGGTWSGGSGHATVGATTGVVNGTSPGLAYIYYTMPGGCYASTVVTVNGVVTGTIHGPTTVCVGSTITLTDSLGSSGTWSSGTTSVATISSGGVVTGVAVGTTVISFAVTGPCGTGYATYTVSVVSTTSPGTISGASTVMAGSNISLSESVTGGTWSSGSTSIATVSSGGVVTGVAAGVATISYTVTGCSGPAYATHPVTVTAFDGISGHVIFSSATYDYVKVWLIKYNPSTHMLTGVDSTIVYCSGTSVYYQFTGCGTDSFRVKAALPDTSFSTTGFMPTYHGAYFYWHDADVIWHVSGTADINKDINMAYGTTTSGPGFIAGDVTTGANKGTAGGGPSVHMHVCVVNSTTHQIIQQTYTDASGHYSFTNLPVGQTYYVFPDSGGYLTTPYTSVSLTSGTPSMTAASFVQHTLSFTITPQLVSVGNTPAPESTVFAFPNPANGKLNVSWNILAEEQGTITLSDVAGRELYNAQVTMTPGAGVKQIDLSTFANGIYLINVRSASIDYNSKIQVQH